MVSEESMKRQMEKEIREKIDRQQRALYKAVRNITRDCMDDNYTEEDMKEMRKNLHEHLDDFMSAELNDQELIFPVDKEYNENHNDS
jgi:hypothetical protein